MFVNRLELKNFRNYDRLELDFAPGNNIICGRNAQGKTNILEAIYLASCARSHRTGKDKELIKRGEDAYQVKVLYTRDNGSQGQLTFEYQKASYDPANPLAKQGQMRTIFADAFPLDRLADLFGLFNAVIFAPEDLMLIKEGPAGRRRFLDILISQLSPSYFRQLQTYQRLLKQRNHILKDIRDKEKTGKLDGEARRFQRLNLDVWDDQLVESAASLVKKRFEIIAELKASAGRAMDLISDQREEFSIRYLSPSGVDPENTEEEIRDQYAKRLKASREDDIFRGYTQEGPHRDDLDFILNGLSAKTYASQGQQRSLVLALKMAELEIIESHCNIKPVLLLDDVMSELDARRRENLIKVIKGHQVFITCTDFNQVSSQLLEDQDDNKFFQVFDGQVEVLDKIPEA